MRVLSILSAAIAAACLMASSAVADALHDLPSDVQKAYEGLDSKVLVGPSTLRDFKPKKGPPWTIGFASSYSGNTWRAAGMDRLMKVLVPEAKKAGLIKDVIITQSDLKDAVQIQQIRQLVDQGVDIVFVCCSNPTALNRSIKYAYDKGVPVVSYDGFVTAPEALSVTPNFVDGGYQSAKSVIEKMGRKGNLLMVSGIAGVNTSDSFDTGALKAISEYPDIKLIGTVQGNWTDQVAQVEVQKFLATHPESVDGVVIQSPEVGVIRALTQSGRPVPPISIQGSYGAACYWRQHPEIADVGYYIWPPAAEMSFAWNVVLRVLEGQGPKIQTIARPVLKYTIEDSNAQLPKDCKIDDQRWLEPKAEDWFPASLADQVFARPSDPLTWRAAK
ncbi:sugar ABC transporter substrate-binding protein [Mesorhizobium sp. M3A.F.Ca.ET.201.01.1.1]|uniref:ABC transporter substrate-binding protein n=1 Tax=Mesorhizobium sp. M3A.F.Ca.ET.201.01.1.1 TaxID=2563946 RepID=UPI0010936CEE|nr:ABC transporter substrate-binding protein [Mesorhizobium sp. M3A.F.Ca.ET.201.01.1.1]TGS65577.1 sugar ABC transporter substrate-binding protein [Mesorhizobium sp. M3A.F.Ca.ET.201.01.1.1]